MSTPLNFFISSTLTELNLNILQSPCVCFLGLSPDFTVYGGVCSTCKPKLYTNLKKKRLWLAPIYQHQKKNCKRLTLEFIPEPKEAKQITPGNCILSL